MNTDDWVRTLRGRVRWALHAGWAVERLADDLSAVDLKLVEEAVNLIHQADNRLYYVQDCTQKRAAHSLEDRGGEG